MKVRDVSLWFHAHAPPPQAGKPGQMPGLRPKRRRSRRPGPSPEWSTYWAGFGTSVAKFFAEVWSLTRPFTQYRQPVVKGVGGICLLG